MRAFLLPNRLRITGVFNEGLDLPAFEAGLGLVLPGLVLPEDFLRRLGFCGNEDSDDFRRILALPLLLPTGLGDPNTELLARGDPVKTLN